MNERELVSEDGPNRGNAQRREETFRVVLSSKPGFDRPRTLEREMSR